MYLYSLYLRMLMLFVGAALLLSRSRAYPDEDSLKPGASIGNRLMYFGGIGLIVMAFLLSCFEGPNGWLRSGQ